MSDVLHRSRALSATFDGILDELDFTERARVATTVGATALLLSRVVERLSEDDETDAADVMTLSDLVTTLEPPAELVRTAHSRADRRRRIASLERLVRENVDAAPVLRLAAPPATAQADWAELGRLAELTVLEDLTAELDRKMGAVDDNADRELREQERRAARFEVEIAARGAELDRVRTDHQQRFNVMREEHSEAIRDRIEETTELAAKLDALEKDTQWLQDAMGIGSLVGQHKLAEEYQRRCVHRWDRYTLGFLIAGVLVVLHGLLVIPTPVSLPSIVPHSAAIAVIASAAAYCARRAWRYRVDERTLCFDRLALATSDTLGGDRPLADETDWRHRVFVKVWERGNSGPGDHGPVPANPVITLAARALRRGSAEKPAVPEGEATR